MSIIRVKKERDYVSIANAMLQNKDLSWEARGIMAYLLSKPDGWECRNYDLVNQGPAGKHIIQRVMKELQEAGYIYRYRKSDGHKIEWITEIYETPELNTTSRNTDILTTEEPTVRNSEVGESGDIVSTDSQKVLTTKKTEMPQSGKDDFSDLFDIQSSGDFEDQPVINGKPELTETEKAHLQTFGVLPKTNQANQAIYTIRQEINTASWHIHSLDVEMAIVHFVQAVRAHHQDFNIPRDTETRKDWYKSVSGHLKNYSIKELQSLYKKAIIKMKDAELSFWRPGSLTKWALPEAVNSTSTLSHTGPVLTEDQKKRLGELTAQSDQSK